MGGTQTNGISLIFISFCCQVSAPVSKQAEIFYLDASPDPTGISILHSSSYSAVTVPPSFRAHSGVVLVITRLPPPLHNDQWGHGSTARFPVGKAETASQLNIWRRKSQDILNPTSFDLPKPINADQRRVSKVKGVGFQRKSWHSTAISYWASDRGFPQPRSFLHPTEISTGAWLISAAVGPVPPAAALDGRAGAARG